MVKKKKLMICNITLLLFGIVTFALGLALEGIEGGSLFGIPNKYIVFAHVIGALMMIATVLYHMHLNLGASAWWHKIVQQKKRISRLLYVFLIILGLSSVVALIHWIIVFDHSIIGAIHGKIGLVFIFLCALHVAGRRKWFKSLILGK